MDKILIAGGSGFLGKNLSILLSEKGYEVRILTRGLGDGKTSFQWNSQEGILPIEALEDISHIINLAGVSVGAKRWTKKYKESILKSRVDSTAILINHLNTQEHSVKSFINASAVGIYGDDRVGELSESSPLGDTFLSGVCKAWEKEANKLSSPKTRLSILRIGIVFSTNNGALKQMASPLKYFMGTYLGNGKQLVPWIHIDDLCRIFYTLISEEKYEGIYNAVGPHSATNISITKAIAKSLNRRFLFLPIPSLVLNIILGGIAKSVTGSLNVIPERLIKAGFVFSFSDYKLAISDLFVREK